MLSCLLRLLPRKPPFLRIPPRAFHVAVPAHEIRSPADLDALASALVAQRNHRRVTETRLLEADVPTAAETLSQILWARDIPLSGKSHPRPILVGVPLAATPHLPGTLAKSRPAGVSLAILVESPDWSRRSGFLADWCSAQAFRGPDGRWRLADMGVAEEI